MPDALNYTVGLRLFVFAEVLARAPATLGARFVIGRRAEVARSVVWRTWAGRTVSLPTP